jgi:chitinase
LTALAALLLYPDLATRDDKESAYMEIFMNPSVFPASLRGFMIAGFAAAYMSTIATHLNWGASYVINDFYRAFVKRRASERHYVIASQLATVLIMVVALVVTFLLLQNEKKISDAWKLLLATGAGTGGVYLLRWYWWRINAWSEVSAMVVAAAVSLFLQLYWFAAPADSALEPQERAYQTQQQFAYVMLSTVVITTIAWLVVTFLTRPEPREKLVAFYERVRPAGPGWTTIRRLVGAGQAAPTESLLQQFVNWVLGCVLIYCSLFGIGYIIFKEWAWGFGLTGVALACALILSRNLAKVAVAAAALVTVTFSTTAAAAPQQVESVFLGYVHRPPNDIRYDLYTHLCHAFVVADGEGTLKPNKLVPSAALVAAAHAANVKVLLSLGGWGWDVQFADMTADPAAEARYVEAVVQLVDQFDYDGLDLDWEYPDTADEAAGFHRLARTLRTRLDELGGRKARPMLLTMAASASPEKLKWLDAGVLVETMNWINVMTYDYTGGWSSFAGHHAPLHASSKVPADGALSIESTMRYLVDDKKLPSDRLAVGLPLYGRAFRVNRPYASTSAAASPEDETFNYARLHELHTTRGWVRKWDEETKNPWLIAPDASQVVGYDDAESAALKVDWAMKQNFRGVFFWQIAGDRLPDGSNPVQQAAHQSWSQAGTATSDGDKTR